VVINHGRIEQVGSPNDLYDHPDSEFVMGFLGPVTRLGGRLVRPHDIEVFDKPEAGAIPGTALRVQRVGFEVRVDFETAADPVPATVHLTRGQAEAAGIREGAKAWLAPARGAST